ncbi:MAG: hypothetical protein P8J29_01480, partial [Rhodospirillales bacterium]|nr:hypothetical protein [Rhodospirillales bacterium]
ARFFCAVGVKADAPVAKTTFAVCGPVGSSGREACCIEFGVVFPVVLPATFPGAGARGLGGAAFANDGAAGGREDVTGGGEGLPVITFDLGFAGGTGALVLFAIFVSGRAEGVSLRVGLRAIRTGAFLDGFRFAVARRLRSSLGGTSFTVGSWLFRRPPSMGGRGANSLLIGIRLGGVRSRSPKPGRNTREDVSTLGPVPLSSKTLRSTSTSFE